MPPLDDKVGRRFGKLVAISRVANKGEVVVWRCQCDCGRVIDVRSESLQSGNTKSCGCLVWKHGFKGSSIYQAWVHAKQRCYNLNDRAFERYGGRGIEVCKRWRCSFENFLRDMGPKSPRMTLERIDNNGNYEPGNCKWATYREQGMNKRNNILISFDGLTLTQSEWSRRFGYKDNRGLWAALNKGRTMEEVALKRGYFTK